MRKYKPLALLMAAFLALTPAALANRAYTVIVEAINSRDLATVQNMLLANSDASLVREKDSSGRMLLHYASGQGDYRIIQVILAYRPDVNARTIGGQTPLIYAALGAYNDNTRLLLAAKADPNIADKGGRTPLLVASDKGKPELAEILIAAGARVNVADANGTTPLMYAAERGNNNLAQVLLGAGAAVTAVDNLGNTPLHYAARRGRRDMIPLFQQFINTPNTSGQTPLDIAILSGQSDFSRELQKFGAVIGKRN